MFSGFAGSLLYIYNGEVRENSIAYRLDIPDHKSSIVYSWKTAGAQLVKVDYKYELIEAVPDVISYGFSINANGFVPNELSKFELSVNCVTSLNASKRINWADFSLRAYFKLNKNMSLFNSSPLLSLAGMDMPMLNITINYRKHCLHKPFEMQQHHRSDSQQKVLTNVLKNKSIRESDYTIAYITFAALALFALIVALSALLMYINSQKARARLKENNNKYYDTLNAFKMPNGCKLKTKPRINLIHDKNEAPNERHCQNLEENTTNSPRESDSPIETQQIDSSSAKIIKNEQFAENQQTKSCKRLKEPPPTLPRKLTCDNVVYTSLNQNIYETLPDQSVNETASIAIANGNRSIPLNITSNTTMQSTFNQNVSSASTASASNTVNGNELYKSKSSISTRMLGRVEECEKIDSLLIRVGAVYMQGTFSKICEGMLLSQNNNYDEEKTICNDTESTREFKKLSQLNADAISQTTEVETDLSYDNRKIYIKMLDYLAIEDQSERMFRESCAFVGLKHKNINPIIGICVEPSNRMAIFSYCENGNLKKYLLKMNYAAALSGHYRHNQQQKQQHRGNQELNIHDLLYMSMQLLKGVNYLHGKRIVHKDVSTRNCW
jgi:hypothetical protein